VIRFYVLPVENGVQGTHGIFSGPKYFTWRYDPDPPGIDCFWARKDYGAAPACLLAADIAAQDHDTLSTLRDVYAFGLVLDQPLPAAERHKLVKVLARLRVPAYWVAEAATVRDAVRTLAAMFLYTEKLTKLGGSFFEWVGGSETAPLQWRWCELSAQQKDWIKQAAWTCGYNLDFVSVNTRMEQLLIEMANQHSKKPIKFGFTDV
jgi:hypothetical protein